MDEIWKPIKDYEGLYEVSNWGRVRSLGVFTKHNKGGLRFLNGKLIKQFKDKGGYLFVCLHKGSKQKMYKVHRLVAQAFPELVGWTEDAKGRPLDELQINHKDQDKTNNRVENLEWCDGFYNQTYSRGKAVYMYTLSGGLCGMWICVSECERNGFSCGNISLCCNGKRKNHKGFKWSYEPPKPLLALPYYPRCP